MDIAGSFAPCPPGCDVPTDIHRHYQRKQGMFFRLATPMLCCGREWARADEIIVFDQCEFCFVDRKPLPGSIPLVPRAQRR